MTKKADVFPKEFQDFVLERIKTVLEFGVQKGYKPCGWMEGDNFNHNKNHDSMFHHLADSRAGFFEDRESGLHPLDHLMTRAAMEAYLEHRGQMYYDVEVEKTSSAIIEKHKATLDALK